MNKKTVVPVLLAGMIFALFSCAVENDPAGADSDNDYEYYHAETEMQHYIDEPYEYEDYAWVLPSANLPEMDFQGAEFRFLAGDNAAYTPELYAEEENGYPVNDAVYRRNMIVREKYNIDIKCDYSDDISGHFRRVVLSGDPLYKAALLPANSVMSPMQEGFLFDIFDLPYIDLTQPWWDKSVRQLDVLNQHYLLGGDLLISNNEAAQAIVFNKQTVVYYGLENPYLLVMEGKWTFDKMNELMAAVSHDLNGDGRMLLGDDSFGLYVTDYSLHSMLAAGGGALVSKDGNGVPYFDLTSEKNLNLLYKAVDMFNFDYVAGTAMRGDYMQIFQQSILFVQAELRELTRDGGFREIAEDCGILPLPKLDVMQESYRAPVNPNISAFLAVPVTAGAYGEAERTGFVLEALAAASRYTLQPAYFDIALCGKFTRDEESGAMLDIIFNSRVYDMGAFYNFGNIFTGFPNHIGQEHIMTIAGRLESGAVPAIERFTGMMEMMEALN